MHQLKFLLLILLLFFVFDSCKDSEKYKKHEAGFEYKILTSQNNNKKVEENSILELSLKYYTQNDSLIFNSENLPGKFRIKILNPETGGLFQKAITLLKEGDSAHFLIPSEDFYKHTVNKPLPDFMNRNENVRCEIKIKKSVSEEELKKEYERYKFKAEMQEADVLSEYIKNEMITERPTEEGFYIIPIKSGTGRFAEVGKIAVVHYEGRLINGQLFDSSIDRGKPVKFLIGQGDVIPAWDKAILKMRVGDKIKLIAPSKTAYGEFGFEKIIPPFSTLIFEIKLIDIQENNTNYER